MMEILFVVPYVPSRVRVRPYHLIAQLAQRGHKVTVLTLWSNPEERREAEALKELGAQVKSYPIPRSRSMMNSLGALPSRKPLQSLYSWQPQLASDLIGMVRQKSLAGTPYVVHVEHLRGVHYGLRVKEHFKEAQVPVIWDSVDSISLLFRQASSRSKSLFGKVLTRLELRRTEYYESWLPGRFNRVLVTSTRDRDEFLRLCQDGKPGRSEMRNIEVVPNGVDTGYFWYCEPENRDPNELVLTGKMSYHANVTMALYLVRQIMPLVWQKNPDVRLTIAGKEPPREVQTLGRDSRVTVTGSVEDLRPYIQKAAAAVAPLVYGVGIQNKILEAMACGTPVVTTSEALSALSAVPGRDLLVADDAAEFAECILRLVSEGQLRKQVGAAGRQYVEQFHHWNQIVGKLEGIYMEEIEGSRSGSWLKV